MSLHVMTRSAGLLNPPGQQAFQCTNQCISAAGVINPPGPSHDMGLEHVPQHGPSTHAYHLGVLYRSNSALGPTKTLKLGPVFFFAGFVDLYLLHEWATNNGAEETTIQCAQYVGMCSHSRYYHHRNHLTCSWDITQVMFDK